MADVSRLPLPCTAFIGDGKPVTAGDLAAYHTTLNTDIPALAFEDGANEYAAVSLPFIMPSQYAGGTLKLKLLCCTAVGDANKKVDLEVYVEAITPNSDNLNISTTTSFDSANGAQLTCDAHAYDVQTLTITLTNKDSVAAGDMVRLLIRRDSDDATYDTAAGDFYLLSAELLETV